LTKKESNTAYYRANREKILLRVKGRYSEKRDDIRSYKVGHSIKNRPKIRAYRKRYYRSNHLQKIKHLISGRLAETLMAGGWTKRCRTALLLGADYNTTKIWIESKFKEGMSWENHGAWHIDHKIPLCSAKTEKELLNLFHYKNLQPLWAEENLRKNRSMDGIS
jgi:hypothetical protein